MFLQPYNTYIQYTLPIPLSQPRHEIFKTPKQEVSQDVTSRDGMHLLQQLCGKLAMKNWIRWKSLFFKNSFILADICSSNSTVYSKDIQLLNNRPISIPILPWCWHPSPSKCLTIERT